MSVSIYLRRMQDLRARLHELGAEALLISGAQNRRWLSGFTGSAGWLLLTAKRALLATDFRYWQQAEDQAPQFELFQMTAGKTHGDLLATADAKNVLFEPQHVTVKEFLTLRELEGVNWTPVDGLVEELRVVKDEAELEKIRAAAAITDVVMAQVPSLVQSGMRELDLAWELEKRMREAGATGLTFPVHVATGPNSALPHHAPGARRIERADIVLVDMGATVDGYGSDLTRTYLFDSDFNSLFKQRYELVLKAHDEALHGIAPGKSGGEIDAIARDLIAAAGYGDNFGHGLGHGLGLEGHEDPRLSPTRGAAALAVGMVTTVEPGVYVPGWGGIRIEDLVVVTEGGTELLSHCPHDPIIG